MIPRDRWSDERYSDFQIAHPSFMASFIWTMVLTLAAIGATFALSCVTPFAALAVALAGTVGLRASLRAVIAVWFANQVIGFGFFHFPHKVDTLLFGVAIGGAAVVTTIVASAVMKYMSSRSAPLRLGVALLLSFAGYETTLLPPAAFFGDLGTFRPAIVAQLAFVNALFLGAGAKVWGYSNALWVGFIFAALILPVFAYRHFVRDGGKFPDGAMEDLGLVGQDLGVKKAGILHYVALAAGLAVVLAANVIFQLPA